MTEDVTKRIYRQHNTKRGYEFFIDSIPYKPDYCAAHVWIDHKKDLSWQCKNRRAWLLDGSYALFCRNHLKIEQRTKDIGNG